MSIDTAKIGAGLTRPALDVQLRRYNRSYRRRLRKLAKSSAPLTDLLYSFPAAAFLIAAQIGNPLLRAEAVKLVKDGQSLKKLALCLGLPSWTRRLPPETFTGGFGALPESDRFDRMIVNLIPKAPEHCATWFYWTLKANNLCHEDFALWVARLKIFDRATEHPDLLLPLAAFVWFQEAEGTRARGLIDKPWTTKTSLAKAIDGAREWFVRMLLEECRGDGRSTGRWFVTQKVSGFRIVPLRQARDLEDEGRRMGHCVGDYVSCVAAGDCLIYSVRRGNDHVATMEIGPSHCKNGGSLVRQLLGPYNEEVDESLWRAVEKWLKRQGRYPFVAAGNFKLADFQSDRWRQLWAPYWESKGCSAGPSLKTMIAQPRLMHQALDNLVCYAR